MEGVFALAETRRIIIDAGHGGMEPGATFQSRQEKNDTLRLALAVGQILSGEGMDVGYTRVTDVYQTPFEKAQIANNAEADYFISLHRNAMPIPGSASGTETLVYKNNGVAAILANNINEALLQTGFDNRGTIERPGLIVLRRTQMPAALVEVGFIDNEIDNRFFDQNFNEIASAIAQGIIRTVEEEERVMYYQVQVGAYRDRNIAQAQLDQLLEQGFPAFMVYEDGLYKVRVGAFLDLDNAVRMEQTLRSYGYSTVMVRERPVY